MATNPLLSTYRGGENRVTSSLMAVFERIDLALVRELLSAATGSGDELSAVQYQNQPAGEGSVPDARISGRFTWWFETKTTRGSYDSDGHGRDQLCQHARILDGDSDSVLFVLTPDPGQPSWFEDFDGRITDSSRSRIMWLSFRHIAEAIEAITSDSSRLIGEQTRFLLAELVGLFEQDGLLTADDTVVVAARTAWPEYHLTHAYVCQPNRPFRTGLTHLGFYADGEIKASIARIEAHHRAVAFTHEEAARLRSAGGTHLADVIHHSLENQEREDGGRFDVLLLSDPNDDTTIVLDQPILNDKVSKAGKPWAWTLSQAYTSLDRLRSGVTRTTEL